MKFNDFERIVKGKYPNAEVTAHGKFGGDTKTGVTVIFSPRGKCYHYDGSYCEILNRLGIKAVYEHHLRSFKKHLEWLKKPHHGFFGEVIDHSKEIEELEARIKNYTENYIII